MCHSKISTDLNSDNVHKLIQIWKWLSLYTIMLLSIYLTFSSENSHCISCLSRDTLKIEQLQMASFIVKVQRYSNKKLNYCFCYFKENELLNVKRAGRDCISTSNMLNFCINRSRFRNFLFNWLNSRFKKNSQSTTCS